MLAAASAYNHPLFKAVLAVHILAAVVWVGGGVVLGLFGIIERSAADNALTVDYLRRAGRIRLWVFLPTSFVLLGCGFGLIALAHYPLRDVWLDLALAGWFCSLALSTGYLTPATEDLVHRFTTSPDAELGALVRRLRLASLVESVILVLVVIDMVVRP